MPSDRFRPSKQVGKFCDNRRRHGVVSAVSTKFFCRISLESTFVTKAHQVTLLEFDISKYPPRYCRYKYDFPYCCVES